MRNDKTASSGVGYCRPPVGRRFQKGQSGNPAGRPKGSRNRPKPSSSGEFQALILEEAYRLIKVRVNDEETSMPIARAVLRSMITKAAKGDVRAQAAVLKAVSDSEQRAVAPAQTCNSNTPEANAEMPHEVVLRIVDPKQSEAPPQT